MKLKATAKYHSSPISGKLTSNFIELSFGFQESGLGAEMFFNRSFEPTIPYRTIHKMCSYMLAEDENPGSSYEPDWRKLEWYHSGYEHNAWFAFPGAAGYQPVYDDASFVINDSPSAAVHIEQIRDNCHGEYAMRVTNGGKEPGGLAQDGKYCLPGVEYEFKGKLRKVSGGGAVYAAFYKEGAASDPVCVKEIPGVGYGYEEIKASLSVKEEGRYTFVLLIPSGSEYVCDDFSLLPSDAIHGFRKSAVEAGRFISPKVMRWPGGCFGSFYDWRDGVGKNRKPGYSCFWGGFQYNDVGTDELASYAEDIGGESMICINMYHPFKRYFDYVPRESLDGDPNDKTLFASPHGQDLMQFTDVKQGALDAAAWVEYCNGDLTTEGGRQRAANGREKPYNVKYWEMDNEVFRWYKAEEYANAVVTYSKAMKAVDPTIKIGMESYAYTYDELKKMTETAGGYIDFFADRGIDESELESKLAIIKEYNEKHKTDIKYCNTEWVPMNGADLYNFIPKSERMKSRCIIFNKWSYALETAENLMTWQRHGEDVDFVCFSAYADNHSQAVVETPKEGVYINPSGLILHKFANTEAYRTLVIEDYRPARKDPVQIQLSMNRRGDALVLDLLNKSESGSDIELDLSAFSVTDGEYPGYTMCADSLTATNTPGAKQIREYENTVSVENKTVKTTVVKLSFSEFVIPLTK